MARTLLDKVWDAHVVAEDGGETLLYVDLHLLHEVTSPQAFAGLVAAGRPVRAPARALALFDHNVPTTDQARGIGAVADPEARAQLGRLMENSARHGIERFAMGDPRNGIVHVVAPEQGRTIPGSTLVCGDSHTSTHGAFGALAFGIGTSQIEHVLATQTLRLRKPPAMRVTIDGVAGPFVSAKDLALGVLAAIGVDGAIDHVIEFAGPTVRALSMEGRMTLCNLAIEMGARSGLIAPDDTTFAYLAARLGDISAHVPAWRALASDTDAVFAREAHVSADALAPMVSWGTTPAQVVPVDGRVPDPATHADAAVRRAQERALAYMDLVPGQALAGLPIDRVFIGSCTNSRIEDLRAVAALVDGRRVAPGVRAMVVPGSGLVRRQAENEGIAETLRAAGFDWREPGCSMCVGMNPDRLATGERCASTSNRNFENRQGTGGRTHLMSPASAAAAAVTGRITDVRTL
ncbi:3-isopropylmalate dehydratase large subunit [Sphingomonas dokdonensis]|uniref:3-isopropylmalate dehydratase large subunit n=1 Tax=Sphingomonas dokdonensis TaxID=344880 RepID=A0A245ZMQ1_9SPHN|nr:3-isopropylmalate dehydratase large subunit [Sphingomonas dokdonensis]OWK31018.1 3-isopropylmalate dehydratase large subunit [Sphingomonas dokdonensis]